MILSKCSEYKDMERFVAYKGSVNIIIHFLCEEQSARHYKLLPFLKKLAEYCVRERILVLKKTLFISIIAGFFILVFLIITQSWMFVFVVANIMIMWCYVLIQLFLDDINCVKVYEFCFDNSSFYSLSNMGVNNKSNRMIQKYGKRLFSIETVFPKIVCIKAIYRNYIMEYTRKITLIKYLYSTPNVFNLGFVKNDDVKNMLSDGINSVIVEINKLGYKVIDLYNVNK